MMENKAHQVFVEMNVMKGIMGGGCDGGRNTNWVVKECVSNDSISIGSISEEDSMDSLCSSSSELTEEASLTSCSSSSHSNGPLYELSELMNHLPIKRGLSMFYQGKAQSFTSLERVQSIEDLPKKCIPYNKRMKSCKSFGGDLDNHRISFTPKAKISKNSKRVFCVSTKQKRGSPWRV